MDRRDQRPVPCKALKCRGCGIALTAVLVGLVATLALGRADEWSYTVPRGDKLRTLTERHLEHIGYVSRLQAADWVGNPYLPPPGKQPQIPPDWARRRLGIARIVDQGGGCTLTRIGAEAPAALRVGVELARGDAVSCGAHSYATLEFEDGSQLRVQPDSKIHLDATRSGGFFEQDAAPRRGRTQIRVPSRAPSGSRFHSLAPAAMTPVNGMLVLVASDNADAASRSKAQRGQVDVAGRKRTVPAAAALGGVTRLGAAPSPPVPLLLWT